MQRERFIPGNTPRLTVETKLMFLNASSLFNISETKTFLNIVIIESSIVVFSVENIVLVDDFEISRSNNYSATMINPQPLSFLSILTRSCHSSSR